MYKFTYHLFQWGLAKDSVHCTGYCHSTLLLLLHCSLLLTEPIIRIREFILEHTYIM